MAIEHMQQHTMDWREQLAKNAKRTRWVMFLFLLIYASVGLILDASYVANQAPQLPLSWIFTALITFKIIPWGTIIALAAAGISLWVTFTFHRQIMLMGTDYTKVTADESNPQRQQLYNVIEEMKVAAGMRTMPTIYIIQADYMNAFASGINEKSAVIAITQGLLDKLKRDELMAVMAHELSHIRHGDIKLTLTASILSNFILILVDMLFYGLIYSGDDRENARSKLFLIIMLLRFTLPIITIVLMLFMSRSREYMADAGCVELMRDNEPLARALMKIRDDSFTHREDYAKAYKRTKHENIRREAYIFDPIQAHIKSTASLSDMFSTHPGFKKRLAALGFTSPPSQHP